MSLRAKAVKGVKWVSVSTVLTVLVSFLQTAVLSHLLSRSDFGLMSMIWVVLGFAQIFSDLGVSNAIVRAQDINSRQLSSVYWLNLGMGILITVLIVLTMPLQVWFYREPALYGLIPWVALTFVFTSSGQTYQMLAQRDLKFHRLAAADAVAVVAGACAAIWCAYAGWGAYALVAAGICSSLLKACILMFSGWSDWHPQMHFEWADLRSFVRFGSYQTGERLSNYAWSNVDYLTVGRFLGADALGIYRLSYELVVRPLSTINPILNTVAYPVFAKRQNDDPTLRAGFVEILRLVATLVCPMLFGLIVVAPLVVPVVFGPKWSAAIPIVQILCVLGIMRSLNNPVGSLILTKGKVEMSFYWNLSMSIVSLIVFWAIAPYGLQVLAWSVVAVFGVMMLLSWKSYYYDTVRMQWTVYCRVLLQPLLFSAVMAVSVYTLRLILAGRVESDILQLVILVSVGGVIYTGLHLAFARDYLRHLWKTIRGGS